MKLGKKALEALQAEIDGILKPGNELIVAGAVAAEGTAWLTENRHEKLREFFAERFLEDARRLPEIYGTGRLEENNKVWKMAEKAGASARYLMGEGGFLAALWKMAEASGVGLEVDLRTVPIRQETIEICEIFDVNPYKLLSGGSILLGISGGDAFVQELRREGIMAAVIGQTNSGNDRLLYSGGNARYLERPAKDEINRFRENSGEMTEQQKRG